MAMTGCGSSAAEPSSTVTTAATTSVATVTLAVTSDVEYLADGTEQLDVIHPREPGSWPVVVVAHGVHQSRSDFSALAEAIASEGAVVFNVDYTDSFPFLMSMEQVACAVRFARTTAPDYGGDTTRVVLFGHSLGGYVGLNVALQGDDLAEGCVVPQGSALPDAFVGYEGIYDMVEDYHEGTGLDFRPFEEDDPDLWHALNPYSGLGRHPGLVVRLIHGGYDGDDNPHPAIAATTVMHQAMVDAGYDAESTVVEGALHGSVWRPGEEAFAIAVQQVMELARG
jgi:acetyl esterase/lipase